MVTWQKPSDKYKETKELPQFIYNSKMNIPYEIHLTIADLTIEKTPVFVDLCQKQTGKAILIELAQGENLQQPMFTKVIFEENLQNVLQKSNQFANIFIENAFAIKRLKIEIPAQYSYIYSENNLEENTKKNSTILPYFLNYFEWHAKLSTLINEEKMKDLLDICQENKVHLSKNTLKNEQNTRFITLREFGNKAVFEQRITELLENLQKNNFSIQKQQAEYCIYDDNTMLDSGWLTK